MAKSLEKMSRDELRAHIRDLDKQRKAAEKALDSIADRERKAARDAAEKVAKEHGFSLTDLTDGAPKARRGGKKAASQGVAKYREPESGATWTGKGRPPAWIREADAAGRPRSDFEIK